MQPVAHRHLGEQEGGIVLRDGWQQIVGRVAQRLELTVLDLNADRRTGQWTERAQKGFGAASK